MNQILDKMILLAFGLISLLIIAPMLFSVVEKSYLPKSENLNEYLSQIDEDISNLISNLENHKSGDLEKQLYFFTFLGEINVIYQNLENSTILHLSFYYNISKFPIYRRCILKNETKISVNSYQISKYSIENSGEIILIDFF